MTEYTFSGQVIIDGVPHQVTADGILTPVTAPPAGGGGGTTPPPTGGTGGGTTGGGGGTTGGGGGTTPPPPPPAGNQCVFGIWDVAEETAQDWTGPAKFGAAPVKSVSWYTQWQYGFPATLNSVVNQHGARLYLNLEPWKTKGTNATPSMADIGKGVYDSYLTSIGNAIKAGGFQVWVTFAHEMNATWYPWGKQAVSAAQWVTTWQHVCDVIRASAGGKATMVWCPNNNDTGAVTPYWPGENYVDIAACDSYLDQRWGVRNYTNFTKKTFDEIRATGTKKPLWNAETSVYATSGRQQLYVQFIADMKADGIIGFTHFNQGDYALTTAEITAITNAVNTWNNG